MANSTPRRSAKASPTPRNPTPAVAAEASSNTRTAALYSTWQVIAVVVAALAILAVACGAGLAVGFGVGRASRALLPVWSASAYGVMPHTPYGQQGMPWYGPMPYGGQMPYHDRMPFLEEAQPALPAAAYLGIAYGPGDEGATVGQVIDGSAAERAGLRVGDVITAVDGVPLVRPGQLTRLIQAHQPGDKVTLTILRSKNEQTIVVTLGTAPSSTP